MSSFGRCPWRSDGAPRVTLPEIAAELEKVKTAAEAKARQMGDYEKVRLQEETNRKLSHSVVETGAELAARRSEIAQEVFDACEERLAAFTAKPEYADYLKKER